MKFIKIQHAFKLHSFDENKVTDNIQRKMTSECLHYREEESRKLVKSLQRQLIEVKREKEIEIQVGVDNDK